MILNKIAGDIQVGSLRGQGEIGLENSLVPQQDSIDTFPRVLSLTIGILTIVAGIWFIFKLITGALGIMAAGADKGKMAEARANITYGFVEVL